MTTTATDHARPVRLPRRSRQGVVLGLDPWQIGFIAAAAVILLIGVNGFGPAGILYAAPIYLPLGLVALTTVHGISAPRMLGLWLSKQLRHSAGATTHAYRPERVQLEGTLNLPGTRASVQVWDVGGLACVYNPHDRSVSITAELEVQGFLMKDTPDRHDLAQQWAQVLATFTPEFLATVQNREDENTGVALSAIGPMYLEEPHGKNGVVITDSGLHTTMWIHEWPRSDAAVGFISPLVFARHPVTGEAVTHILSIVLTPVPVNKALKRIREEKKVWRGNEKLRAKRGADGSAADEADWLALEKQEDELVAGHGEFRYGAYLTVTAADEDALEQSIAGARNALSRAGMEAQILYCQQAEALLVNALPLGLGMK